MDVETACFRDESYVLDAFVVWFSQYDPYAEYHFRSGEFVSICKISCIFQPGSAYAQCVFYEIGKAMRICASLAFL